MTPNGKNWPPFARRVRRQRTRISWSRMRMHMVGHREGERLDGWPKQVTLSQSPEYRPLVRRINRDTAAEVEKSTMPWNLGRVGRHVTKRKLIKRIERWST